jgi:hypothetical protein
MDGEPSFLGFFIQGQAEPPHSADGRQMSIFSAISIASSTSMPR